MYKPTWQIYLNNTIAFCIFILLRLKFIRRNKKRDLNRILIINTGQIGDIIVSSIIFTNQDILTTGREIFLLVRERYLELFKDYEGPIKIIPCNYYKYKFNPFYRITFLQNLRSFDFELCINVTAARGITNDEISLLSGAQKVYCLNNNWKYLTKLFGKVMDRQYDGVLSFNTINEHERNVKILEKITRSAISPKTTIHIKDSTYEYIFNEFKKYRPSNNVKIITIAPISDGDFRNWSIESYIALTGQLMKNSDFTVLLLGTKNQKETLDRISEIHPRRIINLAGKYSIIESAAVVNYGNLFIGNDSGFTHIAKALGKKYIGIIGGGCYGIFFPYNVNHNEHLFYHQMECFGCEWRCMYEKAHCVHNVTVEEVYAKVIDFI